MSGRVATAFYRILFFGLLAAGAVTPARACSTFELVGNGSMVVGHNLDWYVPVDGSVFVNRRGLKKTAWLNSGLQWVSHFGSLTFNSGPGPEPEFPDGGINEAGLVVENMELDATQYAGNSLPSLSVLQWIQYQLDCSASVADVVASNQRVRISPDSSIHFLVADSTGHCATIEFIGGQLVCHTGSTLPVAALTNDTYADSLAYAAITTPTVADHFSSLGRFVQVAASVRNFTQSRVADPISYAFAALDNVNVPGYTRWSVVFDIGNMSVYFRTQPVPLVKQIQIAGLDFRPSAPILMMDINANTSGLVTPKTVYSGTDSLAVPISPPVISAQPVSQTVTAGVSVTFSGTATGDGTLTYQWCKDGVSLVNGGTVSGATSRTLTIANALSGDVGDYTFVATNEAGSVSSSSAALAVNIGTATVTLGGLERVYTGGPHPATATTSPGGLALTFTYDGSGTVPVNAGSYSVVATVSDPSCHGSASGTLKISKAPLIAVADDLGKLPSTANPALTISYTGFVNGETAAVLESTPTASTTATADSPAGAYPITLTGGAANNYALSLLSSFYTSREPEAKSLRAAIKSARRCQPSHKVLGPGGPSRLRAV